MVASMLVFSSLKITDVLKQCTIEIALNLDLPQCGIGSRSNRSAQRPGCLGGTDAAQRNRSKALDELMIGIQVQYSINIQSCRALPRQGIRRFDGGSDHYVGQLHCRTGLRIDLSHGR